LSTVVTIGFNANPLMRYDGYFILSDLVNIPNLHRDAKAAASGFIKCVLYGLPMKTVASKNSIQAAMTAFGIACMFYQVTVSIGIATLLMLAVPVVGPAIAFMVSGVPVIRLLQKWTMFITRAPELETVRIRAISVASTLTVAMLLGITMIPIPGSLKSLGIVHRQEEKSIRASVGGFLISTPAKQHYKIEENEVLYRMDNPELHVQRIELQSQIQQLSIQLQSSLGIDTFQSEQNQLQIDNAKKQLKHVELQIENLNLSAEVKGDFIPPVDSLKAGKFVHQGESLGSICRGPWIVRTMLTEDEWSSINSMREQPINVTLIGNTKSLLKGKIVSGNIAGTKKIEEAALTHMGGGNIAVSSDMVASENFFDVVIEIDANSIDKLEHPLKVGMSSLVQFRSESETIGTLLVRRSLKLINQVRQASN